MIDINRKEVERYLGFRGIDSVDAEMSRRIDECIEEMNKSVNPKFTYKVFPIEWTGVSDGTPVLRFAGIDIYKGNLSQNLRGCVEIVMMAITLGPGPDMLVRKSEVRDILRAYTFQAVGTAMAESWCDEINEKIRLEAKARGLYARPRFSPGYGDFPLEVQRDFEKILNLPKTIGVSLSDSLLMTPTKSVTAVIGLSDKNTDCHKAGCEVCDMSGSCEYSRTSSI